MMLILVAYYVIIAFLINTNVSAGFASVPTMVKSPKSNTRSPAMQNSSTGTSITFHDGPRKANESTKIATADATTRILSVKNNSTTAAFVVVLQFGYGDKIVATYEIFATQTKEVSFVVDSASAMLLPDGPPRMSLFKKVEPSSKKYAIRERIKLGSRDLCLVINGSYGQPELNHITCGTLESEEDQSIRGSTTKSPGFKPVNIPLD